MLRKKEKKAITSTIALLIGWPVGLDQFLEKSKGSYPEWQMAIKY